MKKIIFGRNFNSVIIKKEGEKIIKEVTTQESLAYGLRTSLAFDNEDFLSVTFENSPKKVKVTIELEEEQ